MSPIAFASIVDAVTVTFFNMRNLPFSRDGINLGIVCCHADITGNCANAAICESAARLCHCENPDYRISDSVTLLQAARV